jgi:O-antigen ligase
MVEVISIDKEKLNAYIMAMYIFQFGFLQPLASIINSQIPIAGFSLLLLFLMLINNRFKIKRYVYIFLSIISLYFLFSAFFLSSFTINILKTYGEFLLKGSSAFVIASMPTKGKDLYDAFLKLAIINFISIALFPFVSFLDSMNYMRFGYAMLPSIIMFLYASYDSGFKNLFWNCLLIISLLLTVFYGSRGPIVALILFLLLILFFTNKICLLKKTLLTLFSGITAYFVVSFNIVIKVLDYFYYELGIRTYSLVKLRIMMIDGLAKSSSGRDVIYTTIIELIKNKPIIGYGIGTAQIYTDFTAHNIILQILLESGIIGLLVWLLLWSVGIYKYIKISKLNETGYYRIITLLIAVSIGRLLISSDMWLRPEYWFVFSLIWGIKLNGKMKSN